MITYKVKKYLTYCHLHLSTVKEYYIEFKSLYPKISQQFHHIILFLEYYVKLEIYCNLNKGRKKSQTIKDQAMWMIVRIKVQHTK